MNHRLEPGLDNMEREKKIILTIHNLNFYKNSLVNFLKRWGWVMLVHFGRCLCLYLHSHYNALTLHFSETSAWNYFILFIHSFSLDVVFINICENGRWTCPLINLWKILCNSFKCLLLQNFSANSGMIL